MAKQLLRVGLVVAGLMLASPSFGAAPASSNAIHRRFQAQVVAVDTAHQTLRLRHKPTGFEVDVTWDANTRFSAQDKCDLDDLSPGWKNFWVQTVNKAGQSVSDVGRVDPLTIEPARASAPVEARFFAARLVREPLAAGVPAPATLLSRKGDAAYFIDVNGERWKLAADRKNRRPRLIRVLPFAPADLKPGLGLIEMTYLEESSGARLLGAVVPLFQFKPQQEVGRASGATPEQIGTVLEQLRQTHAKVAGEIRRLAPVTMRVSPEVALEGEPMLLQLEAWATKSPNSEVNLEPDYFKSCSPARLPLRLTWREREHAEGLTRYTADLSLPTLSLGPASRAVEMRYRGRHRGILAEYRRHRSGNTGGDAAQDQRHDHRGIRTMETSL